jgi:hypothetical protein
MCFLCRVSGSLPSYGVVRQRSSVFREVQGESLALSRGEDVKTGHREA